VTYSICYLADAVCQDGQVKCEGLRPITFCIARSWLCDGDNDCGNNWDEDPELCGQFLYMNLLCGSMVQWLAHLEFELGDPGSIPGSRHYSIE